MVTHAIILPLGVTDSMCDISYIIAGFKLILELVKLDFILVLLKTLNLQGALHKP